MITGPVLFKQATQWDPSSEHLIAQITPNNNRFIRTYPYSKPALGATDTLNRYKFLVMAFCDDPTYRLGGYW